MSNYYVRREGDDSDYLEHSIFQSGYRGSHKYIARMNIGGKMRYFYDPRELSVFKAGGRAAAGAAKAVGGAVANVRRKGLGRAVADATGLTARNAYQRAKKARMDAASSRNASQNANLQRAAGRAKKAYNKTLLGRIENAGNKARRAVGKAAGDARRAGGRAVSNAGKAIGGAVTNVRRKGLGRAVADATGLTARNAYQRAKKARTDAASSRGGSQNVNLQRAAGRAKKAYNKTPLGRIENVGNKARRAMGKAAGDARRAGMSFAGSISNTAYNVSGLSAKRAYKEAARKGDRYGKSLQKHGKGRYSGGTFDGTSGNRGLDAARSKTVKRNSKATVDAYNRYMNTPAGVFDRYVGDPINNLRKKVKKKRRQG